MPLASELAVLLALLLLAVLALAVYLVRTGDEVEVQSWFVRFRWRRRRRRD